MRKFFKIAAVNVMLMVVLFLFAEVAGRKMHPDYVFYARTYPTQYQNPVYSPNHTKAQDQDLGWVMNRSCPEFTKAGLDYKINNQGFRDNKDFTSAGLDFGKKRIMVLGDSFVFGGEGRPENVTIPAILQKRLKGKYQVFNLGIPGWGLDQMLLAYQKFSPVIRPEIVICIFISQDIERVFEAYRPGNFNKPSYEIEAGRLTLRQTGPNWLERLAQKSYLLNRFYRNIYRRYQAKRITGAVFLKLIKSTQENRQRLIVIKYPVLAEVAQKNTLKTLIREKCFLDFSSLFKGENAYFELKDQMRVFPEKELRELFLGQDMHPSNKGYEYCADFIAGLL